YDVLRKLAAVRMAADAPDDTLQPTALVHEAYLRLVGGTDQPRWDSRGHFFAAAAEAMRRILVEAARRKHGPKHGGHLLRHDLDPEYPAGPNRPAHLLALDEALDALRPARAPGGRGGQAPLLRWPDCRGGCGRARHLVSDRGQRLGVRPGLAGRRPPRRKVTRGRGKIRWNRCVIRPELSHCRMGRLLSWGSAMSERDIFTAARQMTDPAARSPYLA